MTDVWGSYPETVLDFPELQLRVDLRRQLAGDTAKLLRDAIGNTFAIVTADYPCGEELSTEAHEPRFAELTAFLDGRGHPYVRADGIATEDPHRERGVAVIVDRSSACEIARRFDQLGIFWFDGTGFWLVPVLRDGEAVHLPPEESD